MLGKLEVPKRLDIYVYMFALPFPFVFLFFCVESFVFSCLLRV